jgi:hypothetical protein
VIVPVYAVPFNATVKFALAKPTIAVDGPDRVAVVDGTRESYENGDPLVDIAGFDEIDIDMAPETAGVYVNVCGALELLNVREDGVNVPPSLLSLGVIVPV